MTKSSLPATGPIWLEARAASPLLAVRLLEDAVLRMRPGARLVVIKCDGERAIEAVLHWAEELEVPFERIARSSDDGPYVEIRLYLLPADFGMHPFQVGRRRTPLLAPRRSQADLLSSVA